jgi:hypothetical protein
VSFDSKCCWCRRVLLAKLEVTAELRSACEPPRVIKELAHAPPEAASNRSVWSAGSNLVGDFIALAVTDVVGEQFKGAVLTESDNEPLTP